MCFISFNRAAENPASKTWSHSLSLRTNKQVPVMIQSSQAVFSYKRQCWSSIYLGINAWVFFKQTKSHADGNLPGNSFDDLIWNYLKRTSGYLRMSLYKPSQHWRHLKTKPVYPRAADCFQLFWWIPKPLGCGKSMTGIPGILLSWESTRPSYNRYSLPDLYHLILYLLHL